jgi:hypothetical protein
MVARRRSIQSALALNVREGFGAIVLCLLISCGGGVNGLEGSLPSGRWSGTWTETCSDGHVRTSAVEVSITENVISTEFTTGPVGINYKFHYVSKGKSEWLDPNGNIMGHCSCTPSDCDCSAMLGRLQMELKMSLSKTEFALHETRVFQTQTCQRDSLLRKTQ